MREVEPASPDLRRFASFTAAGAAALAVASAALSYAIDGPLAATLVVAGLAIVTALAAIRLVRAATTLAARERAASEARFRDAVGNMGEGLVLWDRDGRIVLWNERLLELLPHVTPHVRVGATLDEVNGAAIRALHPDWSDERIRERLDWRARAQAELDTPHVLERPDGGLVELVSRRTPDGGLVTIYRDVTEAHRAAREMALSEARFRDGIQCMADGFVMWDAQDRLVTWNERHLEQLPYLRPFLKVGANRRDIVIAAVDAGFPDKTPEERRLWVEERIASFRAYDKVFIMRPAGGTIVELVERRTSEGGSVVLYRDVTERERQADDLRRALAAERDANQQQRRFVAIASHEFRTPLTVIDGSAQRLAMLLPDGPPDVHRRLARIRATVLRMTQLIDRTLSSARLDDGRLEPRPEPMDLAALLREACNRQRSISPEFELRLEAPDALPIVADPRLLELVATNLLSNAVKYSGESRIVEIALRVDGPAVRLAVRDHGVGIPAEELPRIFQRFYRASTATGIPGTGIGLHLVRELVAMHGGTVEVESARDSGATFVVTLPRIATARRLAPARTT